MLIGFCRPDRLERGGDKAHHPECAPTWHVRLLNKLAQYKAHNLSWHVYASLLFK